jgi:hypothetical protein
MDAVKSAAPLNSTLGLIGMKLLLESEDVEYVHALRSYLEALNIQAVITGENTLATSPGAIFKLGLWSSDDAKYKEAMAHIQEFDKAGPEARLTATELGDPVLARTPYRFAPWIIWSVVIFVCLYIVTQVFI